MRLSADQKIIRHTSDLISIKNLADFLRDVLNNPSVWNENNEIKNSLASQGALARLELPDKNIYRMSLNHQKSICIEAFGSYETLNILRKGAAKALYVESMRAKRGNLYSKQGMASRIHELEIELTMLLQDLFLLQRSYDIRCLQARSYAGFADAATISRCIKEQNELDVMFSLRKVNFNPSNVSNINKKLK